MGGKSRKSGGVSKKLIAAIKRGSYRKSVNENLTENEIKKRRSFFEES